MTYVQWNLDPVEITEIDIYEISVVPEAFDKSNDKRLLILSHLLASKRIPAFFLSKSPEYSNFPDKVFFSKTNNINNSIVIVFDIYHIFKRQTLFDWCQIDYWKWNVSTNFQDQLYDDFQRALNVASYYDFEKYKPLYFSSYLLFPGSKALSEPFLYQKIPIRRDDRICIRTSMQGSLDFIIDYRSPPEAGSYILLPPFEHPFCVISTTGTIMYLRSVEKCTISVDFTTTVFVLITKPCALMAKFFLFDSGQKFELSGSNSSSQIQKPQLLPREEDFHVHSFKPVDFHDYNTKDIEDFLDGLFSEPAQPSAPEISLEESTEIVCPDPTIDQILSQMVRDFEQRSIIKGCIGEGQLPSTRVNLKMPVATFLSFFRFDFGFSDVKPPYHAQDMIECSMCCYEKLGIPSLLVNYQGKPRSFPANTIIDQWEEQRIQPISGAKSAHFVVFSLSSIPAEGVRIFFTHFCNTYNLLNFGTLSPITRDEPFHFHGYNEMPQAIEEFFSRNDTAQFQQFPVLSFIVAPPIYEKDFRPHSIISYVRPESILSAGEKEMKTLAFVVYSRIRTFNPSPFGMIDVGNRETSILFFGFRYGPPFLLARPTNDRSIAAKSMTIHIAWDKITKMSSWIDDTGSILHVLPNTDFNRINQLINDARHSLSGIELNFTLSILAEGITNEVFRMLSDTFGTSMSNLTIFAVSPAPTVQVLFEEQFDEDAVIFAPAEQFLESHSGENYLRPQSTCYVVAHTLPAYSVSLYSNPSWSLKSPKETVLEYAKQMSHLSWLSVKPGSEIRTISYPPHICALLKKTGARVVRVSRYEFLPSLEII